MNIKQQAAIISIAGLFYKALEHKKKDIQLYLTVKEILEKIKEKRPDIYEAIINFQEIFEQFYITRGDYELKNKVPQVWENEIKRLQNQVLTSKIQLSALSEQLHTDVKRFLDIFSVNPDDAI
ncbi:MAG: hypothetical protein HY738_05685 [Bacteroidia bacterium]|nr:hypothetical protein [Bacteroidia bacterium]